MRERRLVVDAAEAETVRAILRRYLELGCVRRLKAELDRCAPPALGLAAQRRWTYTRDEAEGERRA